ncbi:MAG: hypothetical protein ABIN95_13730 [Mucilaginibacter sp.]
MKKFLLALVVLGGAALNSFAQSSEDGGKFSIGFEAGLPVGSAKDAYSSALGGSLQYDQPVADNLFVTITAGYTSLKYKGAGGGSGGVVPVKAGLKYYFSEGFFGEAQAGAAFFTKKPNSGAAFAYAPGIGYTFAGGFEAGVRYETWSKNGSTSLAALRLAYRF